MSFKEEKLYSQNILSLNIPCENHLQMAKGTNVKIINVREKCSLIKIPALIRF